MDWQYQVATFMREVKGLELPKQPTIPHRLPQMLLCKALLQEELGELCRAMQAEDLVQIADGLADLLYVTLYTANSYGLYMTPIFQEVQRSNMTKKGGPKAPNGKQLKPSGYEPPVLQPIIEAQKYRVGSDFIPEEEHSA